MPVSLDVEDSVELGEIDDEEAALPWDQREAGMRWIVWDGILASTMGGLTGGVFLTGFALLLGATETVIGLLSGLPRLAALMQPLGAYFVERLHLRKTISVWVFGPARALWALVLLLPAMGYAGGASRSAMLLLLAVAVGSSLMSGFAAVSWLTWMSDLIPAAARGRFFSRRTMLAGITSAVIGMAAGKFVDMWKVMDGGDGSTGFLVVFGVGMACGFASWYTLLRCPEPAFTHHDDDSTPFSFRAALGSAWSDLNFRRLLYFTSIVTGGVWIAGPFFSVYMIKTMNLPYSIMSLLATTSALGSLLTVRLWGRLSDHFGNRPVILAAINGVSLTPVLWLLTAGGAWWPLIIANVVGGASWGGYFLAQMNLVFKITPNERKSVYIALFYALDALPMLFAPLLGGLFLQHTPHWALHVGSWTFVNYHVLFAASGFTRLAASGVFKGVREPRAKPVGHMIRVLSHFRSLNPVLGLQYSVHVVSDVAGRGTRRAARVVHRTARRVLNHFDPDKTEGAD